MTTETPFVLFWRALNIALVAQGEPEATMIEAQQAYAARIELFAFELMTRELAA